MPLYITQTKKTLSFMLNFLANLAIFSNELHHFESEQIIIYF